ncbi:MAG TPA: BlaI/MecI/CopY family transcriptional regulator [Pyrinomonadaceae bacterium]|nr:BlaI/MecI/CopY family transcriptional regulator [Pyrinomonadaceae bacterium]
MRWILRGVKSPRLKLPGFKRAREAVTAELGVLERDVMMLVWRDGESSVHEIHRALGEGRAYTTVMTTLDRLFRKGLISRRKSSRAYLYSPRITREEFERRFAVDILDGLFSRDGRADEALLSCIVDAVSERDRELLDELDRLVKMKKQELKRKESK